MLVEILIPSVCVANNTKLESDTLWMMDLEALDERCDTPKRNLANYQQLSIAYDKLVRKRSFQQGDVLCIADHVCRGIAAPKFTPKWEGPFIIEEAHDSGYCKLHNPKTNAITPPINLQCIKFHL